MEKTLQADVMGGIKDIWNNIKNKFPGTDSGARGKIVSRRPEANISYNNIFSVSYSGEKNLGEIGPIKNYLMDHDALRLRSWQSYIESEISQIVLNKFAIWVVGAGLKLQAEPARKVLESEGIILNAEDFNDIVEARFNVFANSKSADYSNMKSLNAIGNTTFLNSIIGGDVLIVLRLIKGEVKVQLIDGAHLVAPLGDKDSKGKRKGKNNRIRNGIEISSSGEHVAYWVKTKHFEFERIKARGDKSGLKMAFIVYGGEYRLDNVRGIPKLAPILETLKKLERYKEATVGSAEERQKIVLQIIHDQISTGENPFQGQLAKAYDDDAVTDDIPTDDVGNKLADTVAATTNKAVYNMPKGAELKALESKNELYFKDFYTVNINVACATLGIPPEVALSKYDSNFSASRAALKDWEHTIKVNRRRFSEQFMQPIYEFWLEVQILQNKVQAPGYLLADNNMVKEAYQTARFTGATIPHIDPLKEVNAVREKLGDLAKDIPLTTVEAATEELNGGDSSSNMEQYAKELVKSKELGIKTNEPSE
ncbi:hypothetical protein LCGC14_0593560 [marine sediment metagenome]|uniref:Portal protein n=1 Tax=marine sediment metagenome TaxID=412755 RepID=A0A0F9TYX3_9ZZZZ